VELSVQLQAPASLAPGKECPITHRIVEFVAPRAGLDDLGKSEHLVLLTTDPRARTLLTILLYLLMFIACIFVR